MLFLFHEKLSMDIRCPRLNFVPHHPPVFYLLDENGKETESMLGDQKRMVGDRVDDLMVDRWLICCDVHLEYVYIYINYIYTMIHIQCV